MIEAVAKPPGWPEDRLYTDVLTEDMDSGEAFSYTGICECGWEGPSHAVPLRQARTATTDDYETAKTAAQRDVEGHVREHHPDHS
jgi:hypothetical protein